MRRYAPSFPEKFFARFLRMVARLTGTMRDEPGPHVCFRCSLYDPKQSVCKIVVFRGVFGRKDPATGRSEMELRRTFPFDPCVRQWDEVEVFDMEQARKEAILWKKSSAQQEREEAATREEARLREMRRASVGKGKRPIAEEEDD